MRSDAEEPHSQAFPTAYPYDLADTFFLMSMGRGDPCFRFDSPRQLRLAVQTPEGPAVCHIIHEQDRVRVTTSGPAGDWLSPYGADIAAVRYQPPELSEPAKLKTIALQHAGMRLPRLPVVSIRLVQIILQQLISFRDACAGWRNLVQRYGTPVPHEPDLWYPPTPLELARLVSTQFIECGILPRHGRTIVDAMRRSRRIEQAWAAGQDPESLERVSSLLAKLPGIGPWTIGFLRGTSLGDADAELRGDYSHPGHVAYFFGGGAEATDEAMFRLLEPYRPHRFYAMSLIARGSPRPRRRGPRRRSLRERFR